MNSLEASIFEKVVVLLIGTVIMYYAGNLMMDRLVDDKDHEIEVFIKSLGKNVMLNSYERCIYDDVIHKDDISESFDLITPYWPLPYNEMEALEEKTLKYVNIIEQRFGKSIGFLRVKRETIKDIAIRETYIIRHKFHAMRVIFTYYKSDEGWLVNSFKWDDSYTDEFKED